MKLDRPVAFWLAVGALGFVVLPWYAVAQGVVSLDWVSTFASREHAPSLLQALLHGRVWLLPLGALLAAAIVAARAMRGTVRADALIAIGAIGIAVFFIQGFAIGAKGWTVELLAEWLPTLAAGQPGMGIGAAAVGASFAMLLALGLADRGFFRGDRFVSTSVIAVTALVALFTFYPLLRVLASAFEDNAGGLAPALVVGRVFTDKVWGLACVGGGGRCGVAWNTLALAIACASACTLLGLAFALIVTRTAFPLKRMMRALTVLPIITPPFVLGLGLILIFGRSGVVNQLIEWAFGVAPGRWIYGMQGVLLAQVFAFTPIAFLVLIGVVEGVSPTLEEASRTLRGDRWRTFTAVSLPLMRPGLANAFLVSFIESIADFGNPIVLGGSFNVLATEIFFSFVGAQLDAGRAAALALVLLGFALAAFFVQQRLVGRSLYTTIAGKAEAAAPSPLPRAVERACHAIAVPWIALTIALYGFAAIGGFVETWGRDYTPTLKHYVKAFGIERGPNGLIWTGAAWTSFWTTIELSAIAAPLTAALGILCAYLLTRQRFFGRDAFEFGTLLSFAIPGTVIGISYIVAFNVPPIEITGTAVVLVACFVFRNMPVGVRAGIASMAQIDRSLDEASATLGARGFTTLRRVILPLLKPAIVAALVYSFVRAVTTVSAVIFLVSAEYEMATTYIINRVVNGDYGIAIAYCSVLIVLMAIAIAIIRWLVGERRLGRRTAAAVEPTLAQGTAS